MLEVTQGDTIVGKSGKKLLVERVEGELIFCAGGIKVRRDRVLDVIPPPHPPQSQSQSQEDRSLENILSVTQTLQVVVKMCDEQATESLNDLRQVWDKELLQAAASHLPTSARSRLKELVVKLNQETIVMVN